MSMINLTVCHLKCCHRDHSLEQLNNTSIFMTKKKHCTLTQDVHLLQIPLLDSHCPVIKNVEDQFRIPDSLTGLIYFQNFCWNGTILSHTPAPIQQKKKKISWSSSKHPKCPHVPYQAIEHIFHPTDPDGGLTLRSHMSNVAGQQCTSVSHHHC